MRWRHKRCPQCGARYRDLRTGLTWRDIVSLLWSNDPDPGTWRHKRRGTILGTWHQIKRGQWIAHLDAHDYGDAAHGGASDGHAAQPTA